MRLMRTLLVVSLSLSCVACGGFVDVKRKQTALYTFKTGEAPSVSLIQVSGGQDARGTPESFEELKGLIADAAKKYLSEQTPPATFEDLHGSGYNADFGVDLSKGFVPAAAVKLNGPFPASVKTNLVTIAYIYSIKTSMTADKDPVNQASVSLLLATYTRSGELVRSEIIYGDLAGKSFGSTVLKAEPSSGAMVVWFKHSTGESIHSAAFVKDDRAAILAQALHDVVGLHYFAFFPHEVWESLAIMDGPGSVEGNGLLKQFKLGEALQAYEKALTPGSTDAATMGNAALVAAALGDDAKAAAWAAKAVAIEPSMRNKQINEEIELRQGTRKAF